MRKLKAKWTIEPGDGSGCSIQDAQVRNEMGICSMHTCGKPITENAISYGILQKLCPSCEEQHKNNLKELI